MEVPRGPRQVIRQAVDRLHHPRSEPVRRAARDRLDADPVHRVATRPQLANGAGGVTFTTALRAAETAAILDVNLAGGILYPIGEALEARGIPFVLTSGYGDGAAPRQHPGWPTCRKSFTTYRLASALTAAVGQNGVV
jgi:hypothetical protein